MFQGGELVSKTGCARFDSEGVCFEFLGFLQREWKWQKT